MRLRAGLAAAVFAGSALLSGATPALAGTPDEPRTAITGTVPSETRAPGRFEAGEAGLRDGVAHGGEDVVAAQRDPVDRMTVAVALGDAAGSRGPYAFLVDTGAERTVIARSVADALGLVVDGRSRLVGMAGTREVDMVTIAQITLGRRSLYAVASPVLEAAAIGADGIIGLDGLQGQRVVLDFERSRLVLGDAVTAGGNDGYDIVVRARRKSGQLIMTDALIDGVRTDIVIDTGSDTSIGNAALALALTHGHSNQTVQLVSVTGQQTTAQLGMARTLKMSGLTLNNTMIAFSDAPPFARLGLTRRPALLLGMTQLRLFHRVAIDFATRRILFAVPDQPTG